MNNEWQQEFSHICKNKNLGSRLRSLPAHLSRLLACSVHAHVRFISELYYGGRTKAHFKLSKKDSRFDILMDSILFVTTANVELIFLKLV